MENVINDSVEQESERERREVDSRVRSWTWSRIIELLTGMLVSGAIFFYLQFSTDAILDVDGYYHIRWSRLLWEGLRAGQFPPSFPWLPPATLNLQATLTSTSVSHRKSFPWFADIRLGAKLAAPRSGRSPSPRATADSRYRIKYSFVWLIALLACAEPVLTGEHGARTELRSSLGSPDLLSLRAPHWLLAPLAFFYV